MNKGKQNIGRIIPIDIKLESINPFKEPLTSAKLKSISALESLKEEDAQQIVNDIHSLCGIIYDFLVEGNANQKSISETTNNDNNQQKQAA